MTRELAATCLGCFLLASCGQSSPSTGDDVTTVTGKVVFGDAEPRKDLDKFPGDLAVWKWSDATAIMTAGAEICRSFSDANTCILDNELAYENPGPISGTVNLCHAEPFSSQYTMATSIDTPLTRTTCTAFLVGDDLMLTAGHCVQADDGTDLHDGELVKRCSDSTIIFGFNKLGGPVSHSIIRRTDIYKCKEIVSRQHVGNLDYALVRTDRPVIGHHRLRLRRSNEGSNGTAVVVPGYPLGLPLKIDDTGKITEITAGCNAASSPKCLVQGNYSTNGGTSGAPVINRANGLVEAIHFASPTGAEVLTTENSSELEPKDLGSNVCVELRRCPVTGCTDPSTIAFSQGTSVKALDLSKIPDLPAAGVKLLADFDVDGRIDTLSLAPSGGTYHLKVDYGAPGKADVDNDTLISQSAVPPAFDLSWTVTVRDFDGDGDDDIVSAFAGFAPVVLYGGASLRAPEVSPFSAAINYGGFSVADINGDEKADLVAQNIATGGVARFLGSDTGLVRAIDVPAECRGPSSPGSVTQQPHALAVVLMPSATLGIPVAHAVFDCPGPNGLNRIMYYDLVAEKAALPQTLTAGGNWRAFAYRRVQNDILAVEDRGTEYAVYVIGINDPNPVLLFTKPLAADDRVGGVTWNEEDLRVHVLVDHRRRGANDPGDSEIQIFHDSGNTGGVGPVFADCRNPYGENNPVIHAGYSTGIVAGAGADTIACESALFDPVTIPMEIATDGTVTQKPRYLASGPFDNDLLDIECDPLGGVLWGLSNSGRRIYAKRADFFTTCPVPGFAPFGFKSLPPMGGGDWRANGLTLPVGPDHSLLVSSGNTTITGPLIAAAYLQTVGTELDVDVLVPSAPGAPAWAGTVQLLMSTPQSPLQNVGTVDMTQLSRGQWHALRFPLTSAQSAALVNGTRDVSFTFATNLPASPEPLHIGSLRFAGTLTTRTTVPTDDPYGRDPVFGFEDATTWRSSTAALAATRRRSRKGRPPCG